MIAVVDYGRGNLFSLGRALEHLGASYTITADPAAVRSAERVILPGVGAFGDAVAALADSGMIEPLRDVAANGTPLLGICLGMQLLIDRSEEFGSHAGLGLIPGTAKRLPEPADGSGPGRIPNVGWRPLEIGRNDDMLAGMAPKTMMYFVHSYVPVVEDPSTVVATIEFNSVDVAAVIRRENVVGCQFHPERSAAAGLDFLRRFLERVPVRAPETELSPS